MGAVLGGVVGGVAGGVIGNKMDKPGKLMRLSGAEVKRVGEVFRFLMKMRYVLILINQVLLQMLKRT
jgi:hypothetical protein